MKATVCISAVLALCAGASQATTCPTLGSRNIASQLQTGVGMDEISGVTISNSNIVNGGKVFWAISDSGAPPVVAGFDMATGRRVATINLPVPNVDYEDITLGPCGPGSSTECIFVCDTGNNDARKGSGQGGREVVVIHKFQEPSLNPTGEVEQVVNVAANQVTSINFRYQHDTPGLVSADLEAVAVDHITGDIILVTKWDPADFTSIRVFRIPYADLNTANTLALPSLSPRGPILQGNTWTKMDVSRDGSLIVLGSVNRMYMWTRDTTGTPETIESALSKPPCAINIPKPASGDQHEAVTFDTTRLTLIEVSEGANVDAWTTALSGIPEVVAGGKNPVPGTPSNPNNNGTGQQQQGSDGGIDIDLVLGISGGGLMMAAGAYLAFGRQARQQPQYGGAHQAMPLGTPTGFNLQQPPKNAQFAPY